MIQMKSPDKPKSSIDHRKIHGGHERQASSRLPPESPDTKTSGGADLKKKLKKAKSNKVFYFDCFEQSPSRCKKISSARIRNYMKPTSSSDARKEKLQVTVTSNSNGEKKGPRGWKNSNLKAVKSSMKKNANRATCSSTLKNSKLPAALELNHGATEAEGPSKIRVCPYTYCSLNGHMHEPLPPLKYFISARRNLLKTQRNFKVKRLFSVQTSLLENEGEMIDDGDLEQEIGENSSDIFVEIYTKPQMNDSSCISFGYDYAMEQSSESSQEEMDDGSINLLEYVEFDHARATAQRDSEEDGEIKNSEIEAMDMNWEEEILSVDAEDDAKSEEGDSHVIEEEDSETKNCHSDESCMGDDSENLENVAAVDYEEIDGNLNFCRNFTQKRTTEEFEQIKEFNPRPPNFLPLEPDPEAEKVDLRHQTMDERRNSEEWMIDYALQQAVTKLGPASKKKVALLVQAFETITPSSLRENCLSHGASTFNHLSFLQACN